MEFNENAHCKLSLTFDMTAGRTTTLNINNNNKNKEEEEEEEGRRK